MLRYFVFSLPAHLIKSFTGRRVLFLVGAVVATYFIVETGTDWKYFLWVRDPELNKMFFPAVIIGAFVPVSLPLFLVAIGAIFRHRWIAVTGWALGQAALLGSITSSILKAFTGRMQPPNAHGIHQFLIDNSHGFQFGFMRHGVFWGWPSSHTTIAFAMAFTLIALHVKNKHVLFYSVIYAFYIGIGVSLTIHWFSEFIAGALIGIPIGLTVGTAYVKHLRSK